MIKESLNPRLQIDETWSIKVADASDDKVALYALVEEGIKAIGEPEVDWDFALATADQYINGPMTERVFLVLYRDLKPVGVLLGAKVDLHPVFKKTGITIEQLWWVTPAYRGNKVSTKLIDAFEEWSKQIGVKRCVMGHFNNPIGDKVKKYYERSGFTLLEQSYVKEVN